jgi:predicted  nucleic acid-binding Zn-ribbon protein
MTEACCSRRAYRRFVIAGSGAAQASPSAQGLHSRVTMHPDLDNLIALQLRDTGRARMMAELAEAPRRVAAAEAALLKAEAAVAAAVRALAHEETVRRGQELDVAAHRAKLTRLAKQLEAATTTQQVAALEHEMAFGTGAIATLEDDELASMERTETQDAAHSTATARRAAATEALANERAAAADTKQRNTLQIKETDAERVRLRALVSEPRLALYDRVSKARGTGISEAVDHKCSACQMMVRPQRWNDLTDRSNPEAIFTCESCGRLLFYDPRRDAPGAWTPGAGTPGAGTPGSGTPTA